MKPEETAELEPGANDGDEAGSFCSRCRATVPLTEWKLSSTAQSWKHVGPLRDGPDFICDPDEDGNTECGWVQGVPTKIGANDDHD